MRPRRRSGITLRLHRGSSKKDPDDHETDGGEAASDDKPLRGQLPGQAVAYGDSGSQRCHHEYCHGYHRAPAPERLQWHVAPKERQREEEEEGEVTVEEDP